VIEPHLNRLRDLSAGRKRSISAEFGGIGGQEEDIGFS
jgi:hypothetical protein